MPPDISGQARQETSLTAQNEPHEHHPAVPSRPRARRTTRPTFTIWFDGPGGVNGYLTGPDTNLNGGATLQRALTATNSDGYLSPLSRPGVRTAGVKTESTWEAVGTETVAGASRTVHSARWNVVRACSVNAGEDKDLQISWADGRTSSGRLTDAVRLVPLGMAAPQWAEVTGASSSECASAYAHDGIF